MSRTLTSAQIKLLKIVAKHSCVLANWKHRDLLELRGSGFVAYAPAYSPADRVCTLSIWSITEDGRVFLHDERAGQ